MAQRPAGANMAGSCAVRVVRPMPQSNLRKPPGFRSVLPHVVGKGGFPGTGCDAFFWLYPRLRPEPQKETPGHAQTRSVLQLRFPTEGVDRYEKRVPPQLVGLKQLQVLQAAQAHPGPQFSRFM